MTSGTGILRGVLITSVSAALLVAGCGDDDNGGVSADGDSADEVSMTNDQTIADGAIASFERTLRDEGFVVATDEDDDDDDDLDFESEDCQELDKAMPGGDDLPGETVSADSDDFERGEFAPTTGGVSELVSGTVDFVEDADDVDRFIELLDTDRVRRCIEEALRIGFEDEQVGRLEVDVEPVDSQGLGDTGAGFETIGEVTGSGITMPFSLAVEVVRVDRAVVSIAAMQLGANEPTVDRTALLRVLVDAVDNQSI